MVYLQKAGDTNRALDGGEGTADAITIEGIKNEDDDRQINKDKNESGVNSKQRARRFVAWRLISTTTAFPTAR